MWYYPDISPNLTALPPWQECKESNMMEKWIIVYRTPNDIYFYEPRTREACVSDPYVIMEI